MDKLEYFILKNSNIVEQLIKLEERNIVFESTSEDFNNWKSLAYKAILDEDIKFVNKSNNLIYESLLANGYKAESLNEHILSENDLREAAKEYYDQVKKDIELINKYPDILTDKYNSKESLIKGLEDDIIEPFELYDWIVATLNEHNILTEDYTKADDEWGDPYTYEEVYDNLKSLTNDFSDKDGNVRCQYEQEKIYGVDILKKYYKVVETSDARMTDGEAMSWVISYSGLKK